MATASSSVKRVKVEGSITLVLSPEEAVFLRTLLGETDGSSSNSAEKYSESIWQALADANVPRAYETIFDGSIECIAGSHILIEAAVSKFET